MKVVLVPVRLRMAIALMAFCIPIAVAETLVVTQAHWWNLPLSTIRLWTMAVISICIPLMFWLAAGKRWALALTALFGGAWCALSAWVAWRNGNPALGFFTLFLSFFWLSVFFWLRQEMGRTFLDSGLRWFQGLPSAIPGLDCEIEAESGLRVSRMDENGAFVFSRDSHKIAKAEKTREMTFAFRGRGIRCTGRTVSVLKDRVGLGFQFSGMTADGKKELGDFVESLRGEGHVR